jgi:IclR family transcriptional regulator, KDG regulon repressor
MQPITDNAIQLPAAATEKKGGVRPLSSVLKTLALLDALATSPKAIRLADLTRLVGGERGTVYQRLVTLMAAGWVEQLEDGSFRLSLRAVQVAHAALEQGSFGARVVPAMQRLVAEVGETASLAVLDRDEARIVQRVESDALLRADSKLGSTLSLDNSATGRVLVAFADPERLAGWRERGVVLPDAAMLAQVRRESFAVSGSRLAEISASGAPVFDAAGRCYAALSLVGPANRFDAAKSRAALMRAAEQITRMIQGKEQ